MIVAPYQFICFQPKVDIIFQTLRRTCDLSLRQREQRLARISLLIVLIFVICHTVKNIPSLYEICGKDPRVRTALTFNNSVLDIEMKATK